MRFHVEMKGSLPTSRLLAANPASTRTLALSLNEIVEIFIEILLFPESAWAQKQERPKLWVFKLPIKSGMPSFWGQPSRFGRQIALSFVTTGYSEDPDREQLTADPHKWTSQTQDPSLRD
jgi:hypothetical protein